MKVGDERLELQSRREVLLPSNRPLELGGRREAEDGDRNAIATDKEVLSVNED